MRKLKDGWAWAIVVVRTNGRRALADLDGSLPLFMTRRKAERERDSWAAVMHFAQPVERIEVRRVNLKVMELWR